LAYSCFGLVGPTTVRIAGAIRVLRQLLVSIAISVCNIAIHAIVMAAVLWVARVASERAMLYRSFRLIAVMTATVSVLMVAHIAEVVVWTFAYAVVGVAPPGTDLFYFAFVNYTTLGYGDVTPLQRWELLGPMTAMNGVLLFGWSTAVIFAVLRAVMTSQTEEGLRQKGVSSE
jgi:Ion channel